MNGPRTVDLRGLVLDGPAREGSGRRALRAWMVAEACCDAPSLVVGDDQRMRCGECGVWYSASHSADRMLLARSRHPVGVDVEQERPRPAAMRALARVCGLAEPGLPHWVLFEAYLKALGQAQRMPDPGQGVLPESVLHEDGGLPDGPFERLISPGSHAMGRVTLRGGVHIHYYVFSWHGGYQVAAALVCDTGPSTQDPTKQTVTQWLGCRG